MYTHINVYIYFCYFSREVHFGVHGQDNAVVTNCPLKLTIKL